MIKTVDNKVKKQLLMFLFSFSAIYFATLFVFLKVSQENTIEEIRYKIGNIKADFFENETDFKKAIYQSASEKEFNLAKEKMDCENGHQVIEGSECFNYLPVPKHLFLNQYLKLFNYGAVFFIFLVVVIFVNLIFSFKRIVSPLIENIKSSERDLAYAEVAKQVNHDLKSVLQYLKNVSKVTNSRELDLISERIIEITKDLQFHAKEEIYKEVQNEQRFNISNSVKEVIGEKKSLENGKIIDFEFIAGDDIRNAFANCNQGRFKRMLSNILNNAIDAIKSNGAIKVRLSRESQFIKIEVIDNGIGISSEDLVKIGKKGFTKGKDHGEGRGIFSAEEFLKEAGGVFEINSQGPGNGTTVSIKLPIGEGVITSPKEIVLIDDHKSTYHDWEFSRRNKGIDLKIHYFSSVDEFLAVHESFEKEILIYIDSQLKEGKLGEIESEKIADKGFKSIMIQSSEPENIRSRLWISAILTKEFPY